jgi:hypothetical protein
MVTKRALIKGVSAFDARWKYEGACYEILGAIDELLDKCPNLLSPSILALVPKLAKRYRDYEHDKLGWRTKPEDAGPIVLRKLTKLQKRAAKMRGQFVPGLAVRVSRVIHDNKDKLPKASKRSSDV